MTENGPVRWGILGTANIARSSFLPGLRAARGIAYAVAGRDLERTRQYADANGIERAVEGYAGLLRDGRVEAVYVALPNALHAEWTIEALRAGKTVLCEKPLCVSIQETSQVLDAARQTGAHLWEAFVFPFREQTRRVLEVIARGEIGEVREVHSAFQFRLRSRENIRLSAELEGGALNDVGCYCVRLARLIFAADPVSGVAMARWASEGVDEEMQGLLSFPAERRLLFTCGMARGRDTGGRIIGTDGEIRLTNPFHPTEADRIEIRSSGGTAQEQAAGPEPSFAPAIRHIHAVMRGEEEPRHLAVDDAPGNALGLDLLHRSAHSGHVEHAD